MYSEQVHIKTDNSVTNKDLNLPCERYGFRDFLLLHWPSNTPKETGLRKTITTVTITFTLAIQEFIHNQALQNGSGIFSLALSLGCTKMAYLCHFPTETKFKSISENLLEINGFPRCILSDETLTTSCYSMNIFLTVFLGSTTTLQPGAT